MLKSLISSPFEGKGDVENEMNYEVEFLETLSTLTIRIKRIGFCKYFYKSRVEVAKCLIFNMTIFLLVVA